MIVFNVFSNRKRIGEIPEVDVLIWTASLLRYRSFGYRTKLYCTRKDIPFLDKWGLRRLYDVIDDDTLSAIGPLGIDESKFWSTGKLTAVNYQKHDVWEQAVYSDVDVLMRKPFDLSHDCLVWSPEGKDDDDGGIYVPWDALSVPDGYAMPEHIRATDDAYNCGVLWFGGDKGRQAVGDWFRDYEDFATLNPCEIVGGEDVADLRTNDAVWACNAEQRFLKATLDREGLDVGFVMPEKGNGLSADGDHYYYYRVVWRFFKESGLAMNSDALRVLNATVKECLETIRDAEPGLYEFWQTVPWARNFLDVVDLGQGLFPISSYV